MENNNKFISNIFTRSKIDKKTLPHTGSASNEKM